LYPVFPFFTLLPISPVSHSEKAPGRLSHVFEQKLNREFFNRLVP
jgi:hypothetical protein